MSNEARKRLEEWRVGQPEDIGYTAGNQDFANDVVALLDASAKQEEENVRFRSALSDFMSVRDRFASSALTGIVGAIMADECHNWRSADFAHEAYSLADAMIAERAK